MEEFSVSRAELEVIDEALTLASKLDEHRQLSRGSGMGWKEEECITVARMIVRNHLQPNRQPEEHKLKADNFDIDPALITKRAEQVFDLGKPMLTEHEVKK